MNDGKIHQKDISIIIDSEEKEQNENYFLVKRYKNNLLENNRIFEMIFNEIMIDNIKKFHGNFELKDDKLYEKMLKCINVNLIDFHLIKLISEYAFKSNSNEAIKVLEDFYQFIYIKNLDENNTKKYRKQIKFVMEQIDTKNIKNNLKNYFFDKKFEIIYCLKEINNEDKNIKKLISTCIKKNWNLSNIINFINKLKELLVINNNDNTKKSNIKNEENYHIIKSLIEIIDTIKINNEEIDKSIKQLKTKDTLVRDFYLQYSYSEEESPKDFLELNDLLFLLEQKNLNYFSKGKFEQFRNQIIKLNSISNQNIDVKEWINKFKHYDFNSPKKNEYISEVISIISFIFKKEKKFI